MPVKAKGTGGPKAAGGCRVVRWAVRHQRREHDAAAGGAFEQAEGARIVGLPAERPGRAVMDHEKAGETRLGANRGHDEIIICGPA